MTTTLMNDANNAGTLAPCEFCGTYPNPNDPPCATLEQAYARTEVRPFGCPYFTDSDRKIYPLSTPNEREAIARIKHGDCDLRTVLMAWFDPGYPSPEETNFAYTMADKTIDAILAVRLDEAAIRKDEREKCLLDLRQSYPDHAWLNAACAAIRSITTV